MAVPLLRRDVVERYLKNGGRRYGARFSRAISEVTRERQSIQKHHKKLSTPAIIEFAHQFHSRWRYCNKSHLFMKKYAQWLDENVYLTDEDTGIKDDNITPSCMELLDTCIVNSLPRKTDVVPNNISNQNRIEPERNLEFASENRIEDIIENGYISHGDNSSEQGNNSDSEQENNRPLEQENGSIGPDAGKFYDNDLDAIKMKRRAYVEKYVKRHPLRINFHQAISAAIEEHQIHYKHNRTMSHNSMIAHEARFMLRWKECHFNPETFFKLNKAWLDGEVLLNKFSKVEHNKNLRKRV